MKGSRQHVRLDVKQGTAECQSTSGTGCRCIDDLRDNTSVIEVGNGHIIIQDYRRETIMQMKLEDFNPAEYVQSGGWDWDGIVATVERGVAAEDMDRLADVYGDSADEVADMLLTYCQTRSKEEES